MEMLRLMPVMVHTFNAVSGRIINITKQYCCCGTTTFNNNVFIAACICTTLQLYLNGAAVLQMQPHI